MPNPGKFALSLALLVAFALTVGLIMFDWVVAAGLVALSVAGESLRVWLRSTKQRRSSGV